MKQDKKEREWDNLLRIKTSGRDDSHSDQYRYPYEPTPYSVLERLAEEGYIGKKDTLLDYGCGKGRVDFFLAYQCRCRSVGIEFEAGIYRKLMENQKQAASGGRTEFVSADAAVYPVPKEVNRCYFFNPFSEVILRSVMERILESYYEQPREILLFFYYPSDEYIAYLMTVAELEFYDEIDCSDLFPGDEREKILIFRIKIYKIEENKGFQAMQQASRIAEQYGIADMSLDEINAEIYKNWRSKDEELLD